MARSKVKEQEAEAEQKKRAEETRVLRELMYDSSLFQAHPVVVTNVRNKISELLDVLGRPDLTAIWDDAEKLAQLP